MDEKWQKLLDSAIPVVDYTFNMVASKLDLPTAKAGEHLGPCNGGNGPLSPNTADELRRCLNAVEKVDEDHGIE